MCQSEYIRYEYHVSHDDYDRELVVGESRAGNMTDQPVEARRRHVEAMNKSQRDKRAANKERDRQAEIARMLKRRNFEVWMS